MWLLLMLFSCFFPTFLQADELAKKLDSGSHALVIDPPIDNPNKARIYLYSEGRKDSAAELLFKRMTKPVKVIPRLKGDFRGPIADVVGDRATDEVRIGENYTCTQSIDVNTIAESYHCVIEVPDLSTGKVSLQKP